MKDQERFADRFSVEVDRLLEQRGRAEEEGPPLEYAEMLHLAERLAALDFARDSQLQGPLRRHLLSRAGAQRFATRRRPLSWRRLFPPRPRRAVGALVGLLALVVLVGWTPAGRAVAQAVEKLVRELRWPNTTVQQVSSGDRPQVTPEEQAWFETQPVDGRGWDFYFEGHEYSGCCYSEPARNEVVALSQAINEAGFAFQVPRYLPTGYVLDEVRLLGVAPYDVFLIYEGDGGRLGLYQSLVGVTSEEHPSENVAVVESRAVGVLTDGMLEEVMVGRTPAALIDGEKLVWEENSISFHLIGPGLDKETLVQIAESLAPAH